MTDVVDADELMRRMRRARDCAAQEEERWRAAASGAASPADDAVVRAIAYQTVGRVLDEILTPGRQRDGA